MVKVIIGNCSVVGFENSPNKQASITFLVSTDNAEYAIDTSHMPQDCPIFNLFIAVSAYDINSNAKPF